MYEIDDNMYLYEIIEDYKEAPDIEKGDIFKSFCSTIWSCSNKRRTYNKSIKFHIKKDLLETDIGKIFNKYSNIEYRYYKSITKDQNWCSIIRQKVNNIYTRYFDKEVILNKEYMDLLKIPKRLYYEWVNGKNFEADKLNKLINDSVQKSEERKEYYKKTKMVLSWNEYKKVIEDFFQKCFNNCKLIDDYEDKNSVSSMFDFITEDNFYVKYFNKCLNGFINNYKKEYNGINRKAYNKLGICKKCGKLFERKTTQQIYCNECLNNNLYYERINKKNVKCIDCGKELKVNSKNNSTYRCKECQKKYLRIYDRFRKRKHNIDLNRNDISYKLIAIEMSMNKYGWTFMEFNNITKSEEEDLYVLLSNKYKRHIKVNNEGNNIYTFFINC